MYYPKYLLSYSFIIWKVDVLICLYGSGSSPDMLIISKI